MKAAFGEKWKDMFNIQKQQQQQQQKNTKQNKKATSKCFFVVVVVELSILSSKHLENTARIFVAYS